MPVKRVKKKVPSKAPTKAKRVYKRKKIKIKKGNIMSDADYQAGMTAAIVAYQASLAGVYSVTGFSFTYTPPVTSTPPAETVAVSF